MSVIIDHIDPALSKGLDECCCKNELSTLNTLKVGLYLIAQEVKHREHATNSKLRESRKPSSFWGVPDDQDERELQWVTCLFHWYGVSVCNYARLVGLLKGLSEKKISRQTIESCDKKDRDRVKEFCGQYTKNVLELEDVLVWRHKVFAHFAITDPYKDDNIATLDVSVMSPIGFDDGRFKVGLLKPTKTDSTKRIVTSLLPCWSLTQVHENLVKRYWPDFQYLAQRRK
jgi:hypothetical protein